MSVHQSFVEFAQRAMSAEADGDPNAPDVHQILACLADGEDIYELMRRIPDDKIGEVLSWLMNVDLPG